MTSGRPQSSFVICSFWSLQGLARLGRMAEAQQIMAQVLTGANHLGLFSEHFVPETRTLSNFPQAYSHVGLINAAFAVSPSWTTVLLAPRLCAAPTGAPAPHNHP